MNQLSKTVIILDVRTPEEFAELHVRSAINVDFLSPTFAEKIVKLELGSSYKLYCRSGARSGKAVAVMKGLGFVDVENLGSLDEAAVVLGIPLET